MKGTLLYLYIIFHNPLFLVFRQGPINRFLVPQTNLHIQNVTPSAPDELSIHKDVVSCGTFWNGLQLFFFVFCGSMATKYG